MQKLLLQRAQPRGFGCGRQEQQPQPSRKITARILLGAAVAAEKQPAASRKIDKILQRGSRLRYVRMLSAHSRRRRAAVNYPAPCDLYDYGV